MIFPWSLWSLAYSVRTEHAKGHERDGERDFFVNGAFVRTEFPRGHPSAGEISHCEDGQHIRTECAE